MDEQDVEANGPTLTVTTTSRICKAEEAAAQAQPKIDRLTACMETSSTRCTTTTVSDVTSVKLFEMEFVKPDVTLGGHTIVTLLCAGIFKDKP
eukprot:1503956-Ditylum_brightwellii.AAC.1